jgi:D-beta-D-heptose 7-phosphate kinase/D-beta-D-heptose 1-phosphate adenosyltransferase
MAEKEKIVLVTGGFDPLHSGHIELFQEAKKLGDKLIVGINSDAWLTRKKGQAFMSFSERKTIIENLGMVDDVLSFDDSDNTASGAIYKLMATAGYGKHIIFANGGDRNQENTPEYNTYQDDIEFVYGVGGDYKINSSSTLLENWKQPKVKRNWGWYRVLQDRNGYKIKELVINPNSSLSMQRHFKRAEHWYVLKGVCHLKVDTGENIEEHELTPNNSFTIKKEMWHQGQNKLNAYCHILEIQHGDECIEEDIERRYGGGYTVDEILEAVDHINNE